MLYVFSFDPTRQIAFHVLLFVRFGKRVTIKDTVVSSNACEVFEFLYGSVHC